MAAATMISAEMFEVMAPVLYLSRVFCLQPLKWKRGDYNYVIEKSHAYVAYSNIVVVFFVSASIYGLSQVYQLDLIYLIRIGNSTHRYVTFSDVGVVLIPSVLSVVITSLKIDKYVRYFDYLRKCDGVLQKQPFRTWRHGLVVYTTIFFTAGILVVDMVMWINLASKEQNAYILFGYFFPYYVCYCFTIVVELVYWQNVHAIMRRLIWLNEKLAEVAEEMNNDILFMRIDRKKISNVVDTLNADNLKKQEQKKSVLSLEQIQDLISAYQRLTDATNSINDCFGLIILIILLGCLIHLLVTPYALYAIIFTTGNSMFIVSQSIWMTGHVLRLFLIVEPCHGCLIEIKKTTAMVCKLLCLPSKKEVRKSLEFFLDYLAQCRIEFSAFGLTKIHRGLLTTIAGAVTTYLVILFQFNRNC
ncbi:hypothetical protein Zmor_017032 [Zophobas morio]|uniref:Gustatory receptor n=1 Tax=Zophobas morio TaxID=2755281 RepID=A0AA38MBH2_9CUCU|nr:hypothetical protein Zmor_017032 [Zophobas morio]